MADIVHRIGIRAPMEAVLEAVGSSAGVGGWWATDTTTSSPGGDLTSRFVNPAGEEIGAMTYDVDVRPSDREVRWRFTDGPPEWLGTSVTFNLSDADGMTVVVFGHRGWAEPGEFMAHCSMKWAVFLLSLRGMLETGRGRPAPDDLKIDNWN